MRYAKFEMGNGEVALARGAYERAAAELGEDGQTVRRRAGRRGAWRGEWGQGRGGEAKGRVGRCLLRLTLLTAAPFPALPRAQPHAQEEFFLRFAEFEEKAGEVERARAIYRFALDNIPKASAPSLYGRFVAFEKQHGDREGIETVVVSKRR